MPDHYQTLGVKKDASAAQIRKNFKMLAKQNHPDKQPRTATPAEREEALRKFQELVRGYEILSDSEKREIYDRDNDSLNTTPAPTPAPDGYDDEVKRDAEEKTAEELEKQKQKEKEEFEKRMRETPIAQRNTFKLAEFRAKLKKLCATGVVTQLESKSRYAPAWTNPPNEQFSALRLAVSIFVPTPSRYQYDRDPAKKDAGSAVLNLNKNEATISIDPTDLKNSAANAEAAVEMAISLGSKTLEVPNNYPTQIKSDLEKSCDRHGITYQEVTSPQPGFAGRNANEERTQQENAARATATPTLTPGK